MSSPDIVPCVYDPQLKAYVPVAPPVPEEIPQGNIPRPCNSFIHFRRYFAKQIDQTIERDNKCISKIAGLLWGEMSAEGKRPYEKMANEEKAAFVKMYPNYKYSPGKQKGNKRSPGKQKGNKGKRKRQNKRNGPKDVARIKQLAKLFSQGMRDEELANAVNSPEFEESVALLQGSSSQPIAVSRSHHHSISTGSSQSGAEEYNTTNTLTGSSTGFTPHLPPMRSSEKNYSNYPGSSQSINFPISPTSSWPTSYPRAASAGYQQQYRSGHQHYSPRMRTGNEVNEDIYAEKRLATDKVYNMVTRLPGRSRPVHIFSYDEDPITIGLENLVLPPS